MATGICVEEVMRKAVITITKDKNVQDAAKLMSMLNIGGVIVVSKTSKNKVLGLITKADISDKIVAKGKSFKSVKVGKVMSHPVRTIEKTLDIETAAKIMRDTNFDKLPVAYRGKLVGIITDGDLTRMEPALLHLMREKARLEIISPGDRQTSMYGECESCGNHDENLRLLSGRYLCVQCRDTL